MKKQEYKNEIKKSLIEELKIYEVLSRGRETEFGKMILKILNDTIEHTEKEWLSKGLKIESSQLIEFRNLVVSKLQTLRGLKLKIEEAESERIRVENELNKLE